MSEYIINSPQLQNIDNVYSYCNNIEFIYEPSLVKYDSSMFPWYYIYKIPSPLVEYVFYDTFFKSEEYFSACERNTFSTKWEEYIKTRKFWDFYILDARDYNWELLRYFAEHPELKMKIEYYGNIFWIYHDIGHIFLGHLYTKGTFKHKEEMDASLFAIIRLMKMGCFDEKDVMREINIAVWPLLRSGKIISKHDYKYLLIQMNLFKNLIFW